MQSFSVCFLGGLFLLIGCGEKKKEVEVSETRALGSIDKEPRLHVGIEERLGGLKPPPIIVNEPAGWTRLPATQFRLINFKFGKAGEAYVSISSGGLLENANRWMRQFEKPVLDDSGLALLPRVALLNGRAILLQAEGRFAGGMGKPAADGWALLGAMAPVDDQLVTVKMIGPEAEVQAARKDFFELCSSMKWRP